MSLAGFQRAFAALVFTPALRTEVAALTPPELPPALDGLELTERERRRLHAMARDPGMKVATLLHRANRLAMFTNTLPRTSEALADPRFVPLVHRFWKEHAPTSVMYAREARRFGAFIRELVRTGELAPGPFTELMDAELAVLDLGKSGIAVPTVRPEPPSGAALEEARPRLGPWCRVLPFRLDPRVLVPTGGRMAPLPDALPEEERYLLVVAVAPGQVVPRGLEARWGRALQASTGEHSVTRLCELSGCEPRHFAALAREGWILMGPAD